MRTEIFKLLTDYDTVNVYGNYYYYNIIQLYTWLKYENILQIIHNKTFKLLGANRVSRDCKNEGTEQSEMHICVQNFIKNKQWQTISICSCHCYMPLYTIT